MSDRERLLNAFCSATPERPLPDPVLIVAAHPDDEVLGAGARLSALGSVGFVHVTDGAPRDMSDAARCGFSTREAYAQQRRAEFEAALREGGVDPAYELALGAVDQEVSLDLAGISEMLACIVEETAPAIVVTHPYEGGHPDHDGTCFAVHAAFRLIRRQPPVVIEFASYHRGPFGMETGDFLPSPEPVRTVSLSENERTCKERMIQCFVTQLYFIGAFPVSPERFRLAPAYDFTAPPHVGQLWYEDQHWGMSGEHFRRLAVEALRRTRGESASRSS